MRSYPRRTSCSSTLPPSHPSSHRLVPAVPPAAHVLPRLSTHHRLLLRIDPAMPVSILDNPDKDVTWQVGANVLDTCILTVSEMHKYAIGVSSLPITTEIDKCSICLKPKLHKPCKLPLLPARPLNAIKIFLSILDLSCSLPACSSSQLLLDYLFHRLIDCLFDLWKPNFRCGPISSH
jgi:hypothetical protein